MDGVLDWFGQLFGDIGTLLGIGIANLLAGIVILIVGYIVALLISGAIRRLLQRTDLDNRLTKAIDADESFNIEHVASRIVFYVLMLLVLVIFLTRINLGSAAAPLQNVLDGILGFIPNMLAAGAILLVAWVIATLVRMLLNGALRAFRLDDRMRSAGAVQDAEAPAISQTISSVAFYLILFLFIPSILNALEMEGLLGPVQAMFSNVLGYVPNLFGAALIFVIGFLLARMVRQIVTNLLAATRIDALGERIGLAGSSSLSTLIGTLVYALILIPVVIQALDSLNIATISGPATLMLTTILTAIPSIFGAAIVIAISYFVAKLVSKLVADLLAGVGINRLPDMLGLTLRGERQVSDLVGYVVLVVIMLFATVEAANLLGFENVAGIINEFIQFGGQIFLGIIILAVGLYFANMAYTFIINAGQTAFLATIARVAILVLAGAMSVRQMGLADDIINLAFGILLGAIGIAAAIAFGMGSRELAGREMERFVESMRNEN